MNRIINRSLLIALGASVINFTPHLAGMTKQAKKMQATAQAMADKAQEKTQQLQQQMEREMASQAYQAEYPLHIAARKGDFQKIQQLIASGAAVNKKDKGDRSPLWVASTPEIIMYLLNHGANPNDKSNSFPCFVFIIRKHSNNTVVNEITPEVISLFIAKGVDVNATDSTRNTTALIEATRKDLPEIVKLLLKAGAHVNAKDEYERTALDLAKSAEIKKLLIDAGAKKGTDLP